MDYIELKRPLTIGNRDVKAGDLVAVAEIGEGTAQALCDNGRAKQATKKDAAAAAGEEK